jgi:hypothetical protein
MKGHIREDGSIVWRDGERSLLALTSLSRHFFEVFGDDGIVRKFRKYRLIVNAGRTAQHGMSEFRKTDEPARKSLALDR